MFGDEDDNEVDDDDDDDDVNDDDDDDHYHHRHHHIVDNFGGVLPLNPQRSTFFSSSKFLGLWIVVSNLVCMVLLPWV